MCGIVGYVGPRQATNVVLNGLERLEYRGYDSAGIAVINGHGIDMRRSVGKLGNLRRRLREEPLEGSLGLGHTRWATHGAVTEENAHPHQDTAKRVVVIQNGIVENYLELKSRLLEQGVHFESQTDTEVIAQMLGIYVREEGDFIRAFARVMQELRGGNAVVAIDREHPEMLLAARIGNAGAVVIGEGDDENFIASDLPAIVDYTQQMVFLDDREMAIVRADGVRYQTFDGQAITKQPTTVAWDPVAAVKGGYKHFMQKEIFEQPRTTTDTLRGRVDIETGAINLEGITLSEAEMRSLNRIYAVACGTAFYACQVIKYLIESLARVHVEVDYGSEFRYRNPVMGPDSLLIAVTQSGETVDTLAAMAEAREQKIKSVAILNAIGSQAGRVADGGTIYIHSGPEIAVASTKVFTGMIMAGYLFALKLGLVRGTLTHEQTREHIQALIEIPGKLDTILQHTHIYEELADRYHTASDMLYLGRWINAPIALEGALKMKEISYIHAEGYPAGEMKHGPIALIDERMPVVCIATDDHVYEKMLSNIEQVLARGGRVIALVNPGDELVRSKAHHVIEVPQTTPLLAPVLNVVPMQLMSYYMAVRRGADVDQPRNLAKSVTVE